MKKLFIVILFILIHSYSYSQNDLEISREFGLFTSTNISGYLKPLITSINQSLNSSLYTRADYNNGWSFGLDIAASEMYIPEYQKNFNAELPKEFGNTNVVLTALSTGGKITLNSKGKVVEPTIYGGISTPVFAAPQNSFPPDSFYKSVAYAEGNNIYLMSGLPAIKLFLGIPTRTQIKFTFFTTSLLNSPLTYYTIGINQNLSNFINIFDENSSYSLGLNLNYSSIVRNTGINIQSYATGLNFSGAIAGNLWFYSGLLYENINGNITATRKISTTDEFTNNPYEEVRNGDPLVISMNTYTNFAFLIGLSYKLGFVEFHVDGTWASQPMITGGFAFTFFDTGEKVKINQPIEIPKLLPPPPREIAQFKINEYHFNTNPVSKQHIPIKAEFQITNIAGKKIDTFKIEIYHSKQIRAFLPYIFFDENESTIPLKYSQITNTQANEFSFKQLLGKNSLETYYQILNIVGKRMQDYPNASITLIGCNSNQGVEKNNKKLSQARAEIVKKYLGDVWNIAPQRINTLARNLPEKFSNPKDIDGIAENRRVEITSNDFEIIAPIIIEDTLRLIKPSNFVIKSNVQSPTEIKDWEVNISSDKGLINKIEGNHNITKDLAINLDKDTNFVRNLPNHIGTYLKVANNEDIAITPIQQIPVEIARIDSSINLYNLILFDFNSYELGKVNSKITDYINSDLNEDANVQVIGYTDRIGDAKHNKTLSEMRAKSTANKLKAKNIDFIGKGEDELIYDNSTPEGRFYCRTVQVYVHQKNN
jgi:outer membrane protein OmpA-like peptidoglycan-associated protein